MVPEGHEIFRTFFSPGSKSRLLLVIAASFRSSVHPHPEELLLDEELLSDDSLLDELLLEELIDDEDEIELDESLLWLDEESELLDSESVELELLYGGSTTALIELELLGPGSETD